MDQHIDAKKNFLITGYLGLLAAVVVGVGEFLLHYSSVGYESDRAFGFFQYVSSERLLTGHFIVIAGIPLYFIGYYHFYLVMRQANELLARAIFFLGVLSFTIGGIWVASRGFLGEIVHVFEDYPGQKVIYDQIADQYTLYMESLVNVLRVLVLLISALFTFTILKYKTYYPKWMAIFSPVVILLIVFALFIMVPVIGNYLIPTAMNVAHLVVFSLSLIVLKKSK